MRYGWDHPITARRYQAFCSGPTRYSFANQALSRVADLDGARNILDFAAGLGHTAETMLASAPADAQVLCVEPAAAMRSAGRARLAHPRVSWAAELPTAGAFDRIVCGAALWQVGDLGSTLGRLRALAWEDALLCFTIPSLYLGIPDREGGGEDPLLTGFWAELARGRTPESVPHDPPPSRAQLLESLRAQGLSPRLEQLEYRLTQTELRDWSRIPVLTDALFPELEAEARDLLIDAAFAKTDPSSHRFEGWTVVCARVV
ncbi:MAG: class I SAM-dependent methyltransferase [Myxococcales bacterium]|nr:class I SAM-dependent methyltransferase [Myxococcales bacterium]